MQREREWCAGCQRWLRHDKRYCPLFPGYGFAKWDRCVCTVHTCCDAWPKLSWLTSFWRPGRVYHLGRIGGGWVSAQTTKLLCGRELMASGGMFDLEEKLGWLEARRAGEESRYPKLCAQCERRWQGGIHEYHDFVGGL